MKLSLEKVALFGLGPMGIAHAKVLRAMEIPFVAVGRGQGSLDNFKKETGIQAVHGGVENWLKTAMPEKAIVAVTEQYLGDVTMALLQKGCKQILVEKPGGANFDDIARVAQEADRKGAKVFVGYNRRFYSSTQKAKELIRADGGAKSFHFEFTEWSHVIAELAKQRQVPQTILDDWFLHNSSHVVDLAFFLGGIPDEIHPLKAGSLPWHPAASIYAGAGKTKSGALFSYHANWGAPGRWSTEIMTSKHRYIFKPLEVLQIQKVGSVAVEFVPLEDDLDKRFKPGVYREIEAFLQGGDSDLPSIRGQVIHTRFLEKIECRE